MGKESLKFLEEMVKRHTGDGVEIPDAMEAYANEKVKEQLNSVQSFMQGADEDMVYDYIEKLKNNTK